MPVDKFGLPFFWPSKTGGFFYQQEDNPQNSSFADWPDEMSFPGNGIVRMEPNGATDFGIGKNISGFSDSIGGCDMDFAATQSRGYAYKADDPRDVEYKWIGRFEDIDLDQGCSISFDTGHHGQPEPCCQGFAYMVNLRPGADPCEFRFRKEMWHVHYISKPFFTDSRVNFKLNGHGFIGFAGVRYNKPGAIDTTVILEMWFNNDPIAHPVDGWFKLATLEDSPGSGFGDGGDDCNGDNDQVGTWSNVQNRTKTNSTSGFCEFKAITLREIDPTKSFDDTPPPPGDGGTPTTFKALQTYTVVAINPTLASAMGGSNLDALTTVMTQELVEMQTDPDETPAHGGEVGPAWYSPTNIDPDDTSFRLVGDPPCSIDPGDSNTFDTYADGLTVQSYWSNRHNNCVIPGIAGHTTDLGNSSVISYHGGPVLKNPKLNLIFWGSEWNTQTDPSRNDIITAIRDKLLGTDVQYFDELNQYSGCGAPSYGVAITNTTVSYPSGNDIADTPAVDATIQSLITSALTSGQVPVVSETDMRNQSYIIFLKKTATIFDGITDGYNFFYLPTITPPNSGGGGGGTPPGGGGTGTPSQITPVISYIIIPSVAGGYPDIHPPLTGVQALMLPLAEDLAETMTDPNPDHIDGPGGWYGASQGADTVGEIGDTPCDHAFDDEANLPLVHTFADDLAVEPYWSNKDNACTLGLSGNPGGGEPPPSGVVTSYIPITIFGDVEFFADQFGQANDDHIALVFTEEVMEGQTDPEFDGWQGPGTGDEDDGEIGEYCNLFDNGPGTVITDIEVYPDGIPQEGYWSNRHSDCVYPGLISTPLHAGTRLKYLGGRVQRNPVINLIFWGDAWNTQTQPSRSAILTRIRDKILNPASSSNAYWSELNQYSGCGSPTFGEYITYTDTEPPATFDTDADEQKMLDMVFDAMGHTTMFHTNFNDLDNIQYVVFLPNGSLNGNADNFFNAYHQTYKFDFVFESTNATLDASPLTDSTIDSDGIAWLEATGEIIKVSNSRNDEDGQDYRWSHDMDNAGLGYETTWFVNCQGMTSNGHTAMKLGGPNHSGDCGGKDNVKESNSCCCWYDIGLRQNGDIQTQIERPHPDNTDMDCDDCTMSNIGMTMNDGWIGLKQIVYPEIAGGDVDNGGIRIKFYISTDAIGTNGLPTNDWQLVFDTLDTGQWMGDYKWPMYQELEMRLSNIDSLNDLQLYKDRVFIRRWIRGSTGGTPQCPPGQVWDGLSCVSTGTGRIQYHGGRIMKTPIVNLIFWGADWDSRVADPIRSDVVSYTRDKLMGTDKAYFNNLNQYGGIGVPIFGQAVTNLTWPVPNATRVSEEDARLVINDTIERALLPQAPDFNNTIYIVILPVNIIGYHPQNNAEFAATHGSYKPTLTVTDTGGVDEPTTFQIVQFAFTLKSDINVNSGVTSCAGSAPPPPPPDEPPVDPGGGAGLSFFYKVTSTSNQKEISNESGSDNRTQITEKITSSSNAGVGKTCVQADVLLRKESGTTDVTPLVYFKIWNSSNTVIYTSPTTFTPNELTTSFVGKTFDCSTNTHAFVNGDRWGCEFTGTDPNEFVWTAYATSDSGNTGSSGSSEVYKEGSSYDNQTGRRLSATLWE